jgi:hypothetical protein
VKVLRYLYNQVITKHRRGIPFIILVSFLITFIISRTVIYLVDAEIFPDLYLFVGETHVHHLNYGIFLLSVSGFLGLALPEFKRRSILAIIFGIGLGLTFDEFALWLFLQNDYYARISYEAIIVISLVLINIVYFPDLWRRIFRVITRQENPE